MLHKRSLLAAALATVVTTTALAQPSPNDATPPDSDIHADRLLPQPASELYAYLLNLQNHELLWPVDCAKDWVRGAVSSGAGASAELVYTPSLMHRRLTATISRADPDRLIDIDHAGNKGFVTRYKLEAEGVGTRVSVHTYIQAPPKPFQRFYFKRVQPAWQVCHAQALENLEKQLGS